MRKIPWQATLLVVLSAGTVCGRQHVVVLLDDSGSMSLPMGGGDRRSKIDAAKQALRSVLSQLPADTQLGVLAMNHRAADGWLVPLGPLDRPRLDAQIEQLSAGGGTPLGAFLRRAGDALIALRAQERYGSFRLLVVTDGEASDPGLVDRYLPQILARGLAVDVIGVKMTQDHSLATRVHSYRRADDPQGLERALSEALAETTVSANDAGESDFQLLAPLPDQLAAKALEALQRRFDEPLDPQQPVEVARGPSLPPGVSTSRPGPPARDARQGSGHTFWIVLIVLLLGYGILSTASRRLRRR